MLATGSGNKNILNEGALKSVLGQSQISDCFLEQFIASCWNVIVRMSPNITKKKNLAIPPLKSSCWNLIVPDLLLDAPKRWLLKFCNIPVK